MRCTGPRLGILVLAILETFAACSGNSDGGAAAQAVVSAAGLEAAYVDLKNAP